MLRCLCRDLKLSAHRLADRTELSPELLYGWLYGGLELSGTEQLRLAYAIGLSPRLLSPHSLPPTDWLVRSCVALPPHHEQRLHYHAHEYAWIQKCLGLQPWTPQTMSPTEAQPYLQGKLNHARLPEAVSAIEDAGLKVIHTLLPLGLNSFSALSHASGASIFVNTHQLHGGYPRLITSEHVAWLAVKELAHLTIHPQVYTSHDKPSERRRQDREALDVVKRLVAPPIDFYVAIQKPSTYAIARGKLSELVDRCLDAELITHSRGRELLHTIQ